MINARYAQELPVGALGIEVVKVFGADVGRGFDVLLDQPFLSFLQMFGAQTSR
jgi:hypothetical protein